MGMGAPHPEHPLGEQGFPCGPCIPVIRATPEMMLGAGTRPLPPSGVEVAQGPLESRNRCTGQV